MLAPRGSSRGYSQVVSLVCSLSIKACNRSSLSCIVLSKDTGICDWICVLRKAAETSASKRLSAFSWSRLPPKVQCGANENHVRAAVRMRSLRTDLSPFVKAMLCFKTCKENRMIWNLNSLVKGCPVARFKPSNVTFNNLTKAFSV